ncbi:MAG: hypothetical protein IJ390_13615 [Lachnospiraceae bacterium]|nr:hypothetical protein [Lachnospiraceae bacterium]
MRVPKPFIPVRVDSSDMCHTVHVLDRDYTFGPDGFLVSILSQGCELLAAPVRVVCTEDGEVSVWDDNYTENESESFIQRRADEQAVICGAKQSARFIIDTCTTVDYDGNVDIDFKLMTRGKTVAQVFGIAGQKPICYRLDRLWLEIPLKASACSLFHMYPNSDITLSDGSVLRMHSMSMSGCLPTQSAKIPFKPLFWMGNEERGLGWFAENDRFWQPADQDCAMEVVRDGDVIVLRLHLLDSHPISWDADPAVGEAEYFPIDFHFGLQATPVKPFPKQPYLHNALHLDCGIKIRGNYRDFLSQDNRFDRLKEKGVTTLILHEKWNKSQNWFELSECTAAQLRYIVDECHKRGIKVLPYFGYELSSMSPAWSSLQKKAAFINTAQKKEGGWWRVPFQRDYVVCYQSEYERLFVEGIEKLMDTFHIDGVYLDGTSHARCCCSTQHGCGWYDRDGNLHGTYQLKAIRRLFKRLYDVVESRGGMINVHAFGFINFTALPYIHQSWYGENLQFKLMKGSTENMDLDYFRAEYIGRNMGVPVEFIAYENRPYWTFESALATSILHGILPRPNDIGHPLELMSRVWKIFDTFPIAQSQWKPYWNNGASADHDKVKISYYRYMMLSGEPQILAFVVNISAMPVEEVTIQLDENVSFAMDMEEKREVGFTFGLGEYGYRILFMR